MLAVWLLVLVFGTVYLAHRRTAPLPALGIVAAFLLLDFPANTKHLTDRERAIAIARLQEDSVTVRGEGEKVGKMQSFMLALRDWRTWGFIFGYMVGSCIQCAFAIGTC